MRRAAFAALLVAAVVLSACNASDLPGIGGDDAGTKKGKAAEAVVQRFALADGPQACDMFTPRGIRAVYGKNEPAGPAPDINQPPPAISLAECRRASAKFQGQAVKIERVKLLTDRGAAQVDARMTDGSNRLFTVTLRIKHGAWLIDEIREK
jgi:predicted small secreted protein